MSKKIILKKVDALDFFDSVGNIASKLNINSQAVSQWGENVPEKSAWPLYYLAKGKLKAEINIIKR